PVEDVAAVDLADRRAEPGPLLGEAGPRLAAPGGPLLAPLDDPLEPPGPLAVVAEVRQEDLRVDVPLPAAGQRHVGPGQLDGHPPEGEQPRAGPEAQAAVLAGDGRGVQAGAEEVGE